MAIETSAAFADSLKFLQVFGKQNFCKFATALEGGGLPENKQMLISGIYTFCFCPLLLLFSLSISHPLKYSSLTTCNRDNITKQRSLLSSSLSAENKVSRLYLKTAKLFDFEVPQHAALSWTRTQVAFCLFSSFVFILLPFSISSSSSSRLYIHQSSSTTT